MFMRTDLKYVIKLDIINFYFEQMILRGKFKIKNNYET